MNNLFFASILVFLLTSVVSFEASANFEERNCLHKKNILCQKLIKLHPKMDHKEAYKLSNEFYRAGKKYNIPRDILISIAFQESGFKRDIVRKVTGFVEDEKEGFKKIRVGTDFCMMQIHVSNIKKMELDTQKLLSDSKYCLEAGAKILSEYMEKHSSSEKDWWTRYNARTKEKRAIYLRKVTRHLKKLSNEPKDAPKVVLQEQERQLASNKKEEMI